MTRFDELLATYEATPTPATRDALIAHVRLLEKADYDLAVWMHNRGGGNLEIAPAVTMTTYPVTSGHAAARRAAGGRAEPKARTTTN